MDVLLVLRPWNARGMPMGVDGSPKSEFSIFFSSSSLIGLFTRGPAFPPV